ncbi:MAG: pyrimidine dimer DNA glycosylase/endonuclease V [Terriglobales bacterium]
MWMVNPRLMCRKHLLGEHVELHMLAGSLRRGTGMRGFIENKLIELHSMRRRHTELVREMERRGFRHASPLVRVPNRRGGRVNRTANLMELARRCADCRKLQEKAKR